MTRTLCAKVIRNASKRQTGWSIKHMGVIKPRSKVLYQIVREAKENPTTWPSVDFENDDEHL